MSKEKKKITLWKNEHVCAVSYLNEYIFICKQFFTYINFEIKMSFVYHQARKQKQRKEELPRVPRSLFDKPKEVVMKQKRDAKIKRLWQNPQTVSDE